MKNEMSNDIELFPPSVPEAPAGVDRRAFMMRSAAIGAVSTAPSFAPNTGAAAIVAYSMPGTSTSMPYFALPSTFDGMSMRGMALPTIVY